VNRLVAVILVTLLVVLHQDIWFWRRVQPLVFGFMPMGLFYHVLFTLACALLMWLLVKYRWPSHLESVAGERRSVRIE
jgi:hypothetical protein